MDRHDVEIAVQPLAAWPAEHVLRAYRLIAGDVQALLADPEADPRELAASRRDAELFGVEAMRRGLVFG